MAEIEILNRGQAQWIFRVFCSKYLKVPSNYLNISESWPKISESCRIGGSCPPNAPIIAATVYSYTWLQSSKFSAWSKMSDVILPSSESSAFDYERIEVDSTQQRLVLRWLGVGLSMCFCSSCSQEESHYYVNGGLAGFLVVFWRSIIERDAPLIISCWMYDTRVVRLGSFNHGVLGRSHE